MAEVTTVTGMILSAMPVGEYDRRLVILTKEYGKITVFAKGARKPNSALIGVTRSFIFGTFEVYRGRESYTMYKASAKEYFENVVNDLNAVCYACYFAEIADYYGRENLDATEMINLLYITLKALGRGAVSHELIRFIYEIRMIAVNGECRISSHVTNAEEKIICMYIHIQETDYAVRIVLQMYMMELHFWAQRYIHSSILLQHSLTGCIHSPLPKKSRRIKACGKQAGKHCIR